MLLRLGRGDGLFAVLARVAGDVDDLDVGVREEGVHGAVGLDVPAVLRAEGGGVQRTRGVDGGHLREAGGVDGVDVRGGGPAVADHADVVFLGAHGVGKGCETRNEGATLVWRRWGTSHS